MSDPLINDWNERSHKDDWGVPVVYEKTFRELVAAEVERLGVELAVEAKRLLDGVAEATDVEAFARGAANAALIKQAKRFEARANDLRGEQS